MNEPSKANWNREAGYVVPGDNFYFYVTLSYSSETQIMLPSKQKNIWSMDKIEKV